jgi:hypothetical protein
MVFINPAINMNNHENWKENHCKTKIQFLIHTQTQKLDAKLINDCEHWTDLRTWTDRQ